MSRPHRITRFELMKHAKCLECNNKFDILFTNMTTLQLKRIYCPNCKSNEWVIRQRW